MHGIKIPHRVFALKMPGGLMREGGRICGTLRYKSSVQLTIVGLAHARPNYSLLWWHVCMSLAVCNGGA